MKEVHVIVTAKQDGKSYIYPYQRHMNVTELAIYEVPTYQIRIEPNVTFSAIRFGLTPPIKPAPNVRYCNSGISNQYELHPTWEAGYSPHSYEGAGRKGAWRVFPGKQFLIHEGADPDEGTVGGSIGCIEIIRAKDWNRFLSIIETTAGGSCEQIGKSKSLKLTIEAASFPVAKLRGIQPVSGR